MSEFWPINALERHLALGEKTQNSPRMRQLGLYIPKMVSGSEIGPLGTDLGPSREIVILPISEGQKKTQETGPKLQKMT